MVSLFTYVIAELLTPTIGRFFWRSVKRFPPSFAGVAFVGQLRGDFSSNVRPPGIGR